MVLDELNKKTVAVLGGSYGGYRAAHVLAAGLPSGWRVVMVDRNSHLNHVYNFPRYAVLSGHEHKAFIPYDNLFRNYSDSHSFPNPHKRIHGTITSLHPHYITYTPHIPSESSPQDTTMERTLHFDFAIYALGSHLPEPIDLWGYRGTDFSSLEGLAPVPGKSRSQSYTGMKLDGISCLKSRQRSIEAAMKVLVVGGGALGIQFASDIAAVYPRKHVTLLHSRPRLLPKFDDALSDEVYQGLQELDVHVIFGERLDMSSLKGNGTSVNRDMMLIKTVKGREIEADLVLLCTGQTPNTTLLRAMDSHCVNPENGMVRVSRTMQILAFEENDTELETSDTNPSLAFPSPVTLCGTVPPSPVETLVELESAPQTPTSADGTDCSLAKSEVPASLSFDPRLRIYPHLFAIGDAADAFGAIKAGHTAHFQGEVAARNVIRLVKRDAGNTMAATTSLEETLRRLMLSEDAEGVGEFDSKFGEKDEDEEDLELEEYAPGPPMIKVSLGLTKSAFEVAGVVGTKDDGTDDLGAALFWGAYGYKDVDEEGMWR